MCVFKAEKTWPLSVKSHFIVWTAAKEGRVVVENGAVTARSTRSRFITEWPWARREEITWRPTLPEPPVKAMRRPEGKEGGMVNRREFRGRITVKARRNLVRSEVEVSQCLT